MEKTIETLEVGKDGTTVIQGNTLLTERKIDKGEYILKTDNGYWKIRLTDYLFRFFDNLYMSNIEWLAYSKDGITYEAVYSGVFIEELTQAAHNSGLAPFYMDSKNIMCEPKLDRVRKRIEQEIHACKRGIEIFGETDYYCFVIQAYEKVLNFIDYIDEYEIKESE